jgi:hypothetical protein
LTLTSTETLIETQKISLSENLPKTYLCTASDQNLLSNTFTQTNIWSGSETFAKVAVQVTIPPVSTIPLASTVSVAERQSLLATIPPPSTVIPLQSTVSRASTVSVAEGPRRE